MTEEQIRALAREAYIEDAQEENPDWKPSSMTDDYLKSIDSFLIKFAMIIVSATRAA